MTRRPRKALIIGAGIAGPVTAMFLTRAGIEAELYEAWPYSTGIGGGLQIAPNGMHVLAELGLADELIRNGSIAESFDFYSQGGKKLGSLNQNMQQRFGQPAVNMCRATLNETLIDKAWASNVSVFFEKRLVKIEDRGDQPVIAYFADGTTAQAIRDFTASFSVPATREEVYRAITTPNSWWDQQAEGNAGEQGGEFHAQDHDFSVQEADDGKRVVWNVEPTDQEDHEWDDTSLIFDIEEDDDGETKVNFTHRGMRPHDRGYEEIAKTWKDRIAKGLQPLIGREENS